MVAVPKPPGLVELQPASILLGVDHGHSTGTDHQMTNVGAAARDGEILQDDPPVPLQRAEQSGGATPGVSKPSRVKARIGRGPFQEEAVGQS